MSLEILQSEINKALESLRGIMSEEEFQVFVLKGGLLSGRKKSLKSIAKVTGYSMARLEKIDTSATEKFWAHRDKIHWPNWRRVTNADDEFGFSE